MWRSVIMAATGLVLGLAPTLGWSADLDRYETYRPARAAEMVDTSIIPACDDPAVIRELTHQFAGNQSEYWDSDAAIARLGTPYQVAYRPWGQTFIVRRFCRAAAIVAQDGGQRTQRETAYYVVIDRDGFSGVGWGVRWCVTGYDRNLGYAPDCKMLRP